jgi:2-methylisocitrate lyase-like PEP mutase family enzyme
VAVLVQPVEIQQQPQVDQAEVVAKIKVAEQVIPLQSVHLKVMQVEQVAEAILQAEVAELQQQEQQEGAAHQQVMDQAVMEQHLLSQVHL